MKTTLKDWNENMSDGVGGITSEQGKMLFEVLLRIEKQLKKKEGLIK